MNASNTKILLQHAFKSNISVLINGLHGIGKTSVVKQFAKDNSMHIETLILSLKDPSDLLGMPNIDDSDTIKRTIFAEPDWFQNIVDKAWPKECSWSDLEFEDLKLQEFLKEKIDITENIERKELNELYCSFYNKDPRVLELTSEQYNISSKKSQISVLFLDELNRALPDTRNTALQLVLEKEIHSHKLPFVRGKQTFIVSAINPSDIYQTDDLDIALLDRFLIIDMEVDANDWLKYSKDTVDDSIRSFISEKPDKLHYIQKDGRASATPRSWEGLSRLIQNKIENNIILEGLITGEIGKEVGTEFFVYYLNYESIMKVDDIVELVFNSKDKSIHDISEELKDFLSQVETIRKHSLVNQIIDLSSDELKTRKYNILSLTLISVLESLNFEISLAICKKIKVEAPEVYKEIVLLDEKINNKHFFSELIKYSR